MDDHSLLLNAFVYLLAAVVAVPLFARLGLGSMLGYLVAGAAIGPWGLGVIRGVEDILHFAEFGVVLLLFLIGLELDPHRLWAMRRPIFGLGSAQVAATAAALMAVGLALGLDWRSALVAGMGLVLSSTAIALQILTERNLLATQGGNAGFSILLFQDIAVIPMLALLPLLAVSGPDTPAGAGWLGAAKAVGVIAAIVVGGRFLVRPIFRFIAKTGLREIFTAFSLLLVIGIALLMQAVGLSMALGTFLAGVLLAESEYRHALESDIEPFKGLLLGLFFIAVGMSIDFGLLSEHPALVTALVTGVVAVKAGLLQVLATMFDLPPRQRSFFAVLLSQGGEFAFVLFSLASNLGALRTELSGLLIGVVALSMMTTPLLLMLHDWFIEPRSRAREARPMDAVPDQHHPVIIAGFGRFGQIVGRLLHANGIETTILDHDPEHIEIIRKFGFKVFYGDAGRLDLLRAAGAEQAKLFVLAVDDRGRSLQIVDIVRENFPHLVILTRAWDVVHTFELLEKGVRDVERETFESALQLGEASLHRMGFSAWQAKQAAHQFRAHDEALLRELFAHFREDLEVRAKISASAREQLREQMQADAAFFGEHRDVDWS
ncbi:MAG: glutathione-regulated potassium-efflux system protein KefC [Chromatiaceae bacterium]